MYFNNCKICLISAYPWIPDCRSLTLVCGKSRLLPSLVPFSVAGKLFSTIRQVTELFARKIKKKGSEHFPTSSSADVNRRNRMHE